MHYSVKEVLLHFTFEKGDLVMADAGYATAQNYIYAQKQQYGGGLWKFTGIKVKRALYG